MDIAFLTAIDTRSIKGGGGVYAGQVSRGLLKNSHRLYTNITEESDDFRKFRHANVREISKDIEVFYIRIDGAPGEGSLDIVQKIQSERGLPVGGKRPGGRVTDKKYSGTKHRFV